MPDEEADAFAAQVIGHAKEQYHKSTPAVRDHGEEIAAALTARGAPVPGLRERRDWLRSEGVRDEDIRWWWTMHHLERCALEAFDNMARIASFLKHRAAGLDQQAAGKHVHADFPMFGPFGLDRDVPPPDRALPFELKDRVDAAATRGVLDRAEAKKHTTMNAYLRTLIRAGTL